MKQDKMRELNYIRVGYKVRRSSWTQNMFWQHRWLETKILERRSFRSRRPVNGLYIIWKQHSSKRHWFAGSLRAPWKTDSHRAARPHNRTHIISASTAEVMKLRAYQNRVAGDLTWHISTEISRTSEGRTCWLVCENRWSKSREIRIDLLHLNVRHSCIP